MRWSCPSSPMSIWTHAISPLRAGGTEMGRWGGAAIRADIASLIGGVAHRLGLFDPAFADRFAIVIERYVTAFGEAAAVVLELHTDLMFACRNRRTGFGEIMFDAEEVVAIFQLAVLYVKGPATDGASLRDDHALG